MRSRRMPDAISLVFGGAVMLGFVWLYTRFGIFPMHSRRGREPVLLEDDPDRFWWRVAIVTAMAAVAIVLGIARMIRR